MDEEFKGKKKMIEEKEVEEIIENTATDAYDKKGKRKMFSEEEEKIHTAATTITTTEVMMMDVDHDHVDDDDKKGKKKMSEEEEAKDGEKIRTEKLLGGAISMYYAWAQNPCSSELYLGKGDPESFFASIKREKKTVKKKMKKGLMKPANPNDDMRSHLMGTHLSPPPTEKINYSTDHSIPSSSRNIISADSINKSSSNLVANTEVIKGRSKLELDLAAEGWGEKTKRGRRALTKEEAVRKRRKRNGAYTENKQQNPPLEKEKNLYGDHELINDYKQMDALQTESDHPELSLKMEIQGIDEVEVANNLAKSEEEEIKNKAGLPGLGDKKVVKVLPARNEDGNFNINRALENVVPQRLEIINTMNDFKHKKLVTSSCGDKAEGDKSIRSNKNMLSDYVLETCRASENKDNTEGCSNEINYKQKKPEANSKHYCNQCDKYFSSHQALGGHKSSHSIKKIKDGSALANDAAVLEHGTWYGLAPNLTHQCRFCDKSFSSGQALGGHQRYHYVQPSVPEGKDLKLAPKEKELIFEFKLLPKVHNIAGSSPEVLPSEILNERELDIDLNALPEMKEGEDLQLASNNSSLDIPQPIQGGSCSDQ